MSTPAQALRSPLEADSSLARPVAPPRRLAGLRVLAEIGREAWVGLSRNRFRAGLAMLGISWGIVSVVMLLAYGNGFRDALAKGFSNAFGTGVVISWPGQTSMQAGGERAGKRVRITVDQALMLAELPLVKNVSPELVEDLPVSYGTKQTGASRSWVPRWRASSSARATRSASRSASAASPSR